ncbi:MAG TPA: hypothetical protein VMF11_15955 [Candidatus Baltobacteraceae bacterium]|nr:hypothetical protein [Candidatus Baltobacteraceae bacterium]
MVWDLAGAVASILLGLAALCRSRSTGGFYDRDVYAMTPAVHRRYSFGAAAFALAFFAVAGWAPRSGATIWLFAAFVLFAVFYLTSFLRGASDDDH